MKRTLSQALVVVGFLAVGGIVGGGIALIEHAHAKESDTEWFTGAVSDPLTEELSCIVEGDSTTDTKPPVESVSTTRYWTYRKGVEFCERAMDDNGWF